MLRGPSPSIRFSGGATAPSLAQDGWGKTYHQVPPEATVHSADFYRVCFGIPPGNRRKGPSAFKASSLGGET